MRRRPSPHGSSRRRCGGRGEGGRDQGRDPRRGARPRRGGTARGPDGRPRQRLLRPAPRRPRALPRGGEGGGGRAGRGRERRRLRASAQGRRAPDPARRRPRPPRRRVPRGGPRRCLRGRRRGPAAPRPSTRRALQGHGLHAGDRARARGRALLRRARGHRRGPQGPRHADTAREDPRVKALLVRLSSIGDVVHTLPALAALRRHGWEAGWVVEPPSQPLLADNPELAQVVVAPPARGFLLREAWSGLRSLRVRGYDAALDFQGLWKSVLWARLARARRVVGFAREWRREPASAVLVSERASLPAVAVHVI